MPKVTEILCVFCLQSVTSKSPVAEKYTIKHDSDSIAVSASCRHLMHKSCAYDLPSIPLRTKLFRYEDPVICRYPKCGEIIDRSRIFEIHPMLVDRDIEMSHEKCKCNCNLVEEATKRLNAATCNLVEELTTILIAAKDKTVKREASAKHYAELMAEAENRAIKAEAAALEALQRNKTIQQSNEISTSKHPPQGRTLVQAAASIAPLSGSSNTLDNQQVILVEKRNVSNMANSPNEKCPTIDLLANLPADVGQMVKLKFEPFKERISTVDLSDESDQTGKQPFFEPLKEELIIKDDSADESNQIADLLDESDQNTSLKSSSLGCHAKDPRQQLLLLREKTALLEKPPLEFPLHNINTKHSPQNATSKSPIATLVVASTYSLSAREDHRKSEARRPSTRTTTQEDHSPATKRWKGSSPSESSANDDSQHAGWTPSVPESFFRLNTYPFCYTVASIGGAKEIGDLSKVVVFAHDVLLLGDGHALGIANYVLKDTPYKDRLHTALYRRDLSIANLIETLDKFTALPTRVVLSIGNWDTTQKTPTSQFFDNFKKLLKIFKKCQVRVLYTLPIITYPAVVGMAGNKHSISGVINSDWSKYLGGEYMSASLSKMVYHVINDQLMLIDDKGPMYKVDQYLPLVEAIRDRFIPVSKSKSQPTEDNEEAEGRLLIPS